MYNVSIRIFIVTTDFNHTSTELNPLAVYYQAILLPPISNIRN